MIKSSADRGARMRIVLVRLGEPRDSVAQFHASRLSSRKQGFGLKDVERRKRCCAGKWIAGVCAPQTAGTGCIHHWTLQT